MIEVQRLFFFALPFILLGSFLEDPVGFLTPLTLSELTETVLEALKDLPALLEATLEMSF